MIGKNNTLFLSSGSAIFPGSTKCKFIMFPVVCFGKLLKLQLGKTFFLIGLHCFDWAEQLKCFLETHAR